MIKTQKDLTAIDASKSQESLKIQLKKAHRRNNGRNSNIGDDDYYYYSNNTIDSSRLVSIKGANNTKKPECTYRMEDYLEIIYELVQRKGYATLVDIAECLNVTPPSVTTMMRRLERTGLLNYEKYRGIRLTEKGIDIAKIMHNRHSVLSEFLRMIGVSEKIANQDAESMEHHLHQQTMYRLIELIHILRVSNND
ncbi:MAG: winged helix-turn-helix transcriptional regulator [Thermoproteota archaeon]|nr:winged helix-turn-helix transcriptional regulator [Thermoproteota archaeon]